MVDEACLLEEMIELLFFAQKIRVFLIYILTLAV